MLVLVTGANGLIGSYVCQDLLKKNYRVRALKRASSDLSSLGEAASQIEWIEGDILDPYILEEALQEVDWVIHCAAFISYDSKDQDQMHKVNVEGTANIVDACLHTGKARLLHVSSIAAVGKDKNSVLIDEDSSAVDLDHATSYSKSKYYAELEVWRGTTEGLSAVIVNPSLVIGPGDWEKSSTQIFKYVWKKNRFYTNGTANIVDVRDVSKAMIKLMQTELYGERFILSAGSLTYHQLFNKIAACFEKKAPGIEAKGWLVQFAIFASKIGALLTGTSPFITNELKQVAKNNFVFDSKKICHKTDMTFRSIDETISWCCQQLLKSVKQ